MNNLKVFPISLNKHCDRNIDHKKPPADLVVLDVLEGGPGGPSGGLHVLGNNLVRDHLVQLAGPDIGGGTLAQRIVRQVKLRSKYYVIGSNNRL